MSTFAPLTPDSLPLTRRRCWNHAEREAAARCPQCSRFFCRECVTEHAGRMICAACLRDASAAVSAPAKAPSRAGQVWRMTATVFSSVVPAGAGLAVAWVFFHLAAQWLIKLPAKYHEGTFWQETVSALGE